MASAAMPRTGTSVLGRLQDLILPFGIIGSVLVAFVQVMGAYYFQDLALALMYLLMLLVLIIRPGGLLGKED